MKKLLLVLAVVAMASFLLVGCLSDTTTPAEGEGEGEGECEVTVEIEDAVVVDGKAYVSGGAHDITVTFCAPVIGNVSVTITGCAGDYRAYELCDEVIVVMFPDATRTIWTGSGTFGCDSIEDPGCCASLVQVSSGECVDEVCIEFPVIVDSCPPYAEIEITADADDCCEGCEITFATIVDDEDICDPDIVCCDDTCSGLDNWSMVLYEGYPFDDCCDPDICEEPIGSCSGEACPIECTTECLTEGITYYAVLTLVDNVGNETVYYARIVLGADCDIDVTYGWPGEVDCVDWAEVTSDTIGGCSETCD